ncbi:MAG: hypothetical protein NZ920_02630 [Aigarchaeota archaeon]|nr:hypothetical protein [Aigarchaeota archaeon]MDW8092479.1 hypothetical protein [Nitrososphaerota archaeon]
MSPKKRKLRLELFDDEGDKIMITYEGRLSREKLLQIADLVELYGGEYDTERSYAMESKLTKVARIIEKYFPLSTFSSKDVMEAFINEYKENISLSTVSTYLARLTERKFLERTGSGGSLKYRLYRENVINSEG